MNKKLIAVAIAAAVAAPAAMANDTTLYGKAHVSIGNFDDGSSDAWEVNSHASRLGVKGSEDLGNGLKAIFKYEFQIDVDSNDGINSGRNAYVGLSGDFGTVLAGRHDTPAKVAFYATGNEIIGDSIVDINRVGFTEFRVDNAIAYISPNFSGFTVAAAVVPGEGTLNTVTNNVADGLADAYSIGLMYSGNGIKAGVGYEAADGDMTLMTSGGGGGFFLEGSDHEMIQAGASFTFGDFMVGGNYQTTSDTGGVNGLDYDVWSINGKANFGNNYVMARYGNAELDDGTTSVDVDTLHLAAGHKMSKRTQVYVAYENQDAGSVDADAFALGMIHSF